MPRDWLAARRTEVAADRILDAAGELFTEKEAAAVGMHEIASAAGCSRATLYRYFENRDALFTEKEAAAVGMHEIASAAGCSRATLYRYFENRDALYTAYVHRESYRLYREMTEQINSVVEPSERLIEGMLASLRNVRESPALASWFATTQRPIGAEMAEQSEVINALTEAFVISLGPDEPELVAHRARWLVRVMTSLFLFPGHNDEDERAMLEEFVVPIVLPNQPERTG
jgi:AcrR family transcriptional regulator